MALKEAITKRQLTIDDPQVLEFVERVNEVRSKYNELGQGPGLLSEHAAELKVIRDDTHIAHTATKIGNKEPGKYWSEMAGLGLSTEGARMPLLQTLIYTKLNIFLGLEYGPDETPTTELLRGIGARAIIDALSTDRPINREQLLSTYFFRFIGESIYGDVYDRNIPGDLNPRLKAHFLEQIDSEDIFDDPALARVVAIATYKRDPFIAKLGQGVFVNLVSRNEVMFKGGDNRSVARKRKTTGWQIAHTAGDEIIEPPDSGDEDVPVKNELITARQPKHNVSIPKDKVVRAIQRKVFHLYLAACRSQQTLREATEIVEQRMQSKGNPTDEHVKSEVKPIRQIDPMEVMFDPSGKYLVAKVVCDSCSVSTECLAYAISEELNDGFYGGQSEPYREAIAKSLRRDGVI